MKIIKDFMADVKDEKVELLDDVEDVSKIVENLGLASEKYTTSFKELDADQKNVNEMLEILKYETGSADGV